MFTYIHIRSLERHDIAEILLKLALNTNQSVNQYSLDNVKYLHLTKLSIQPSLTAGLKSCVNTSIKKHS